MKTFLDTYRAGEIDDPPKEILDWIDRWHDSGQEVSIQLHEYLGMSWEDYGRWMQSDSYLTHILAAAKATATHTLTDKQRELLDIRRELRVLNRYANALVEEIALTCTHPTPEPWEWEHDNGYGRQSMVQGEQCSWCRKRRRWKGHGEWSKA